MGSRGARLRVEGGEGVYHLYGKVAAVEGEYPLERAGVRERFVEILRFYAGAYECEVLGFSVMGNHYHIVARFFEERMLGREELLEKTRLFYPNTWAQAEQWSDERRAVFGRRVFNVSEFMRNINQAFAKWFNNAFKRQGRFWADRFRSTLLADERAVLECLLYVELNPVRAGLAARPEDYQYGSACLRDLGGEADDWLADLRELEETSDPAAARVAHRSALYWRGAVPAREGQRAISEADYEQAAARNFGDCGLLAKRMRRFTRGLVLGSKEVIAEWLTRSIDSGFYRRRCNPQACGPLFSLS